MKLILAIIRPYHLETVQAALESHGVSLTSVSEIVAGRREPGYTLIYQGREMTVRKPKYRVEMIVDDFQANGAVEAIRNATVAGCPDHVSDAKIMVMQMEDVAAPRCRERLTASRN